MKKAISLLLTFVLLISVATGSTISAQAAEFVTYAQNIELNTTYSNSASYDDPVDRLGSSRQFHSYQFTIPASGTIKIFIESENEEYLLRFEHYLYSISDVDEDGYIWSGYLGDNVGYNADNNLYYNSVELSLSKGTYFLVNEYYYGHIDRLWGTYNINIQYKPSITRPSSLKISSRGVYSLKLSWGKVANVTGYQVQRKVGDKYKHIAYTSNNYYTVKDLAAATNYALRVRAYKTIDGRKYYSSWRNLTTPTRPSKVSIKSPSTNSKHQIIVKWKALSRGSGYKVQFSRKKDFSTVVATRLVSGKTKTSYTGKNLTKGKKYYVRVRGYKSVDGKKYYGTWSNVKSIKCK